jgi:hypothetical protein
MLSPFIIVTIPLLGPEVITNEGAGKEGPTESFLPIHIVIGVVLLVESKSAFANGHICAETSLLKKSIRSSPGIMLNKIRLLSLFIFYYYIYYLFIIRI